MCLCLVGFDLHFYICIPNKKYRDVFKNILFKIIFVKRIIFLPLQSPNEGYQNRNDEKSKRRRSKREKF
jgi:hypothetical protein